MTWISVSDRWPPSPGPYRIPYQPRVSYLVSTSDGQMIADYLGDNTWVVEIGDSVAIQPTHWFEGPT